MKTIATLTRHVVTYLIGLLTAWLALHLAGDDLKAATDAAKALIDPLVILGGALSVIVARLAMPFLNKLFRRDTGNAMDDSSGSGMVSLLGLLCMAAGLLGALPSCSPAQIAAVREMPIRIGIQGPDAAVSYSSKGGLQVDAVVRGNK
jgi:hypothetical protein